MRFFIVAFTAKNYYQKKAICYANLSQVRQMRAVMTKIITKECKSSSLKDLVGNALGNKLTDVMTKKCKHIFPFENVISRKVKSIKRPRVDMTQLNALQTDGEITGFKLEKEKRRKTTINITLINFDYFRNI